MGFSTAVALVLQGGLVVSDAVLDSLFPGTSVTCRRFKAGRADVALFHGGQPVGRDPSTKSAQKSTFGIRSSCIRCMWPAHRSILSAITLCRDSHPHLESTSLLGTLPGDSEYSPQTAEVEGLQLTVLFAAEPPGLGAVQQDGDHNGLVHFDICK